MPAASTPGDEARHWFREVLGLEPRTIPMPAARETWVAERDDALVGYLVVDPEWLDSLYVRPDLTGQGIGGALLDLAKGLRPDGFGLWVFETNVRAQAFYQRHGLYVVRRTDGSDNEEKQPDLEMAWFGADPARGDAPADRRARRPARRGADRAGPAHRHRPAAQAVPGHAGRDLGREAEIVDRMARRPARRPGPGAAGPDHARGDHREPRRGRVTRPVGSRERLSSLSTPPGGRSGDLPPVRPGRWLAVSARRLAATPRFTLPGPPSSDRLPPRCRSGAASHGRHPSRVVTMRTVRRSTGPPPPAEPGAGTRRSDARRAEEA